MRRLFVFLAPAALLAGALEYSVDPVTRYVRVTYPVPSSAPGAVTVQAEIQPCEGADWSPAAVRPHASDTALELMVTKDWDEGILNGRLTERRAAGLRRSLVWNPARLGAKRLCVDFRVTVLDGEKALGREKARIGIDNSDVVLLNDWSKVVQQNSVADNPAPGTPVWWLRRGPRGSSLEVKEKGVELPQLTYPLDLRGWYAVFVSTPAKLGAIDLRFTGDERCDSFSISRPGREVFWRWADITRQHLVIRQPYRTVHEYEDNYRAHLDTVRLVPLTPALVQQLDAGWAAMGDKRILAGYYEPYSWAFYEKVERNQQHWEPLAAFAEARVDWLDIQIGRGGSRMVFEGRAGSQLLTETFGDPVRGKVPRTSNVGRMQQYTNTLATELRYARILGLKPRANIGATNCYVGTPLESDFSRRHPEWRKGSHLRFEVPEVRRYVLSLFEEALDIGAEFISLDWCRYPNSVTSKETVTTFFRELRALANRYGTRRGKRVDILTRFPARGVPGWQHMDYTAWVREGLVDYLAPSNIQARHLTFDIGEYLAGARGTRAKVLPSVDGLSWGLSKPGMFLERILKMYEAGAPGVYIYQCDAPVLESPESRRYISIAGSAEALRRWHERERREQSRYSKGLYLNHPEDGPKFRPYERIRVWVEGFEPGKLELWLDGKLANSYQRPPYVLLSEDRAADTGLNDGPHVVKVRAWDGSGWLEREFRFEYQR